MQSLFLFLLTAISFSFIVAPANAELYTYVDSEGAVVATDDLSKVPEAQRNTIRNFQNQPANNNSLSKAAPYTKEAMDNISALMKNMKPDNTGKHVSQLERTKIYFEYQRKLFAKAGFDFDDTIDQVVDDLRFHRERMTTNTLNNTVAGYILMVFNMALPDCKYYQIDCIQLFRSKTAEAVKWLSEQNPPGVH